MLSIVQTINNYLSDYVLVILLVTVGVWYTVKTRFVQVRCFRESMRRTFGSLNLNGEKQKAGMSSFQALATAVAAQVGTGNIIGASGAILTGGPGAIFWMWVIAFFGMATIYAEAVLAQETRVKAPDGSIHGGPVYYITKAFKGDFGKFLSKFFAIAITLALGFFGCMVQSNSISSTCENAFGIPAWIMGIGLVVICGIIFLGGVQRLASVVEKVVPFMAVLFILGSGIVLLLRIQYLPATFGMIFKYAFRPNAIIGGSLGYALKTAVSQGAKRGLFSNEAGMGSTPHAHALANVKIPHDQGVVAMAGVFIDTFVVLTMNALVIISTMYTKDGILADGVIPDTIGKSNLAQVAFGTVFGEAVGSVFVAVCLFFFAFSTILSWNLFGKINMIYLFGEKSRNVYTITALGFIFVGTLTTSDMVWELSDMFNQLMVIPNVLALFALTNAVVDRLKSGK
ncbi:sodium:alanine symporter family protein [Thermoclostridium stercorarium]|jgi:AGCS family alanine or glycine:cation symporter|nr:sodium:alanine symporter family protein [Thermoclostridium stercorarium]AGI39876.1 amino acid carrier protein [Thermoclostridium stercorarium subsp. stercorarium DSM 8532]ANX01741.1 alanine glycine permease [Thermoclostridium stercorarium subsp. leptospartum DSM 9219]UZQ84873.1 sodium:alanine symporter family protein [Thermoclostridium stercorarium]